MTPPVLLKHGGLAIGRFPDERAALARIEELRELELKKPRREQTLAFQIVRLPA